ncbi:MAG: RNA-binding protein [Halothiobacillus sp. 24-54-40]|jgi:RNA recognition motif-containing protein|nr:RNA-binding protein [Halothiobacillaceae bacterium]OYV46304.1 MAG: RNA-binding protein [Halothiobacillus sp. 20-53-49]OYY40357.1 MAG: RNA-binding protein [Halothiobacillus sp. 35-54-62]OYZ86262.1 MAG: RNA-binding protein [Halothiobacillus sp. 24-54-40]OZA79777.1 MAG: RNA-binding protein [Halothiobacillus sp. 39-53-45]HQS02715.1 RNA-binding protein [Halothiobacillus sp.]
MINIYVGNLSYQSGDADVLAAFEAFGEVKSAKVIQDMATGRSKGFAFVEMSDKTAGLTAIEQLDNTELNGRNIRVNEARPRERTNDRGGDRGGDRGEFRARR